MNENYLWNKTGEDAEIEKLENALKSLRMRRTNAPPITAKTAIEEKSPFGFLRFAVPSACLAAVLLTLGFWFYNFGNRPAEIALNEVETQSTSQPLSETMKNSFETTSGGAKIERIEEKPAAKRRLDKIRKSRAADARPNIVSARKSRKVNSSDRLTEEEKYAYDQLMTALAVTGSQLKIVREKIYGAENQTVVVKNAQ